DPSGVTLQSIADELNRWEVATARRGKFYPGTCLCVLENHWFPRDTGWTVGDHWRIEYLRVNNDTTVLSPRAVINEEHQNELIEAIPKLLLLRKRGRSYGSLEREFGFVRPRMVREFNRQRERWRKMAPQRRRGVIVQLAGIGWLREEISEE